MKVRLLRNAILTVMLLPVDPAAFAIQFALEPRAFARADSAAAHSGESFVGSNSRHVCFESCGFSTCQLAAANPLIDSLLFAVLALIYSARPRHRYCAHAKYEYRGDEQAHNSFHGLKPLFIESRHPLRDL